MTPDVIRETFPMVRWDMARLRALELPVQQVAVPDLAWQFVHRLLKAALQGRAQIDAMVLSQQDLELICPERSE
jgi:hypothetical protein